MATLKARVARLEKALPARRRVAADIGLLGYDDKKYDRLMGELLDTLPMGHSGNVIKELSMKCNHRTALRLAAREDRFRLRMRPPRGATIPRLCLSQLTLSFIGRLERAVRGDGRPLALPKEVCNLYAWAERYKHRNIPIRECVDCGYDTPAIPRVAYIAALNVIEGGSFAFPTYHTFAITSCPLCGGELAPAGERPWSDRNRDKVVDVHVWPDGEVSVLD